VAEALRVHPLAPYAARYTPTARITPGVTICLLHPASMLNVRGNCGDALFARAVRTGYALALPREPNTATSAPGMRALWLGPDEWLLVSAQALEEPSAAGAGTFVDVSHGRAVLRMSGDDVREALAKGCALDLDPRVFPVDRCAQTAIGKVSVILDHVEDNAFDLYCARSYAGAFWHWLTEACAEYGCSVLA
jgi:sarcosine oxidase subunit gamma